MWRVPERVVSNWSVPEDSELSMEEYLDDSDDVDISIVRDDYVLVTAEASISTFEDWYEALDVLDITRPKYVVVDNDLYILRGDET